ncbi:MAG TPA: hypothetical protein VGS97_25045 [Actinocrinis sp.]|uniref:hypothetical protein n=1 Tax=Actinocrinis sp. TaxID=1920516 RepID=UPI002DDDA6BE|nr:hypothetical protein [Actinocrinis sp.]HEV2347386.1 hypothetical protein [Actinocrinis sp.]
MSDLKDTFEELKTLLFPFAVELGGEVLDVWRDREKYGHEPLPPAALRALALWAADRLADGP